MRNATRRRLGTEIVCVQSKRPRAEGMNRGKEIKSTETGMRRKVKIQHSHNERAQTMSVLIDCSVERKLEQHILESVNRFE